MQLIEVERSIVVSAKSLVAFVAGVIVPVLLSSYFKVTSSTILLVVILLIVLLTLLSLCVFVGPTFSSNFERASHVAS
ncbi:hypothetical protein [Intestinibacter sp.]|uniref:hypothetical protein n=1 Tax=Intestinibacter sp. TaxID=1965304 RepID=UPI002A74E82D|nr:hypothetical protein [Intestinibacter sp.]MDY2735412.1 hypothetical protein [Intestinibacter sp.]